jgi:hypothetical protein
VRERIALGTSAGITGLVGIIWVTTLAATGTFSLAPSSATLAHGDGTNPSEAAQGTIAQTQDGFSQLVGAVGAVTGATSTQPALRIVDGGTTSSLDAKRAVAVTNSSNATVIPF